MQYNNNLTSNINALNAGEAAAMADIGRRTTDAQNAYNSGLASANANIEANYIQNLLNERDKQLQRDLQERQFQEQIRQFNENLALQKQQLYNRFSSGSGGGGGSYEGASIDEMFTDGNNNSNSSGKAQTDAQKYGTFSNGYQPKGISGYGKLSRSGDTIVVNGKTQNIWQTSDGSRWYWDGANKSYVQIRAHTSGGGRKG